MTRTPTLILVALLVGGLAGVGLAESGSEEDAIVALEREWLSRFQARDIEWIVAAHAPDAQQFPPSAPPVVGAEALKAAWQAMADPAAPSLTWEPTRAHVSSSGDMAWDYGTGKLTTAEGATQDVKYVVIWHRIDGEWKIVMDMFSPNSG
jgi:ketosteroid isomerase-like protein